MTAAMAGYATETVTVTIPADGSGEMVEFHLGRAGPEAVTKWNLARKFGPLREATPGPVRCALHSCPPITAVRHSILLCMSWGA